MEIEIEKYSPREDALIFRKQHATFQEAWNNCPRGDWMLWIAKKLNVDLKPLTLAKVRCASTVRHLMKDPRSTNALDVALRFANGEATREELNAAAADAAYAAADAANAAYAAADAADARRESRQQNQKATADICREVLTDLVFEKLGINQLV